MPNSISFSQETSKMWMNYLQRELFPEMFTNYIPQGINPGNIVFGTEIHLDGTTQIVSGYEDGFILNPPSNLDIRDRPETTSHFLRRTLLGASSISRIDSYEQFKIAFTPILLRDMALIREQRDFGYDEAYTGTLYVSYTEFNDGNIYMLDALTDSIEIRAYSRCIKKYKYFKNGKEVKVDKYGKIVQDNILDILKNAQA